jgi:hypothetical protein
MYMFFKIFKQQIYLIIIKVNFFEIIMIFLHFYFFKYDKMTTLLWRYKAYVQVLLVFSLKLFFFNYYQFHDLQFGFVTWIKYYFIEKS